NYDYTFGPGTRLLVI
ncbi:rCG64532, partial [Rattus norvegicus]